MDIARYSFLSTELLGAIRSVEGYPVLNAGFESSLPGLYFVGTTAAYSFGPLCRFVAGTPFTARTLTNYVRLAQRAGSVSDGRAKPSETVAHASRSFT